MGDTVAGDSEPVVEVRLSLALNGSIVPKTGRHISACKRTFDHAAKTNQTRWPWAQTIVTLGLRRPIDGRWCCLALAFAFYLRREQLRAGCVRLRGTAVRFADKLTQAQGWIERLARCLAGAPLLVVCDSWFGNNGLFKPPRERVHLLSRRRLNATLYALATPTPAKDGQPRKCGDGSWLDMAEIELSVFTKQCLNRRIPQPSHRRHRDATSRGRRMGRAKHRHPGRCRLAVHDRRCPHGNQATAPPKLR